MNIRYKYNRFIDWLMRHTLTTLVITFDPEDCRKWTEMSASFVPQPAPTYV